MARTSTLEALTGVDAVLAFGRGELGQPCGASGNDVHFHWTVGGRRGLGHMSGRSQGFRNNCCDALQFRDGIVSAWLVECFLDLDLAGNGRVKAI